jgi:2-oxoglutarate dehydrogenase E2 component (dihydrolipoamide succinyltransferase)
MVVVLPACTAGDPDAEAASSSVQLTVVPDATPAAPDPAPAAPDPAPAAPDPAPAAPDPAPPAPGTPDPAPAALPLPGSRAPEPVSPVAAACAVVLDSLTEAVIRYEVAALAEGSGSGSRSAAATEMLTAIEAARTAASSQGGLPSAAAPAINAVIDLRGGLDSRPALDEEDAAPWRGLRDDLQAWCRAHG